MASGSTYTVFGYGTSLDWRPTTFVIPFPPGRLCSACGLVPPATATLPCRHQLCQSCFDRRDSSGKKRCPLDKSSFQNEDVVWVMYSKDSVLGRKVRCWNAANGCDSEDAASAMLLHFTSACRFHAGKCPTCGASVLHKDFPDHLETGCSPTSSSSGIEQSLSENSANAFMEVKDALRKLSEENASLQTRLNSFEERLSANFDRTMTTVLERTRDTCRAQFASHLSNVSSAIRYQQAENERSARHAIATEYRNNLTSLNATIKKALTDGCKRKTGDSDTILTNLMASSITREINDLAKDISRERTLSGEDASRAFKLLAAAAFGDKNNALSESPPPCTWEIDDWDDFCPTYVGRARLKRRDRFGTPYYLAGRLVVPRLCYYPRSQEIEYRPYIIRGLYDEFLESPEEPSYVRFIHPTDPSLQMRFTGEFDWIKPDFDLTCMGSDVLYMGRESIPIEAAALEDAGFIRDNTAQLEIYHD
ncbi:hypothetical protein HPB50_001772 [Hyalomma asiaticum]|uniref:Uncharacterized protein n=1 Tax=Hyalomma asiaticum TaxID=266040 RepID=A0ACB7T5I3_HYAAI|nr:hypothetical protein HPB50_001772 [Hyalomma asiaticum]